MSSTRLPGKVLASLAGTSLLGHMLQRVGRCRELDTICIATTENSGDDPVAQLADSMSATIVRGDEHDVLTRYVQAAETCGADVVVRLTADCPMTDPALLDDMVRAFSAAGADYLSNVVRRDFPDGLDVEILTRGALERANREAKRPYDREHVTTQIRRSAADAFVVSHHRGPADFSHLRWTVDTASDLANIRELVCALPDRYSWLEAIAELTRRPALLAAMTRLPDRGPSAIDGQQ